MLSMFGAATAGRPGATGITTAFAAAANLAARSFVGLGGGRSLRGLDPLVREDPALHLTRTSWVGNKYA